MTLIILDQFVRRLSFPMNINYNYELNPERRSINSLFLDSNKLERKKMQVN
jgi:hypothetical protein